MHINLIEKRGRLVLVVLFSLAQVSFSAAADPIPQNRRITWQPGVAGGIPNRTTIFTNFTPANTLSQINSAIANCPSNQVVKFGAGIYNFTSSILINQKNGVVLRGAGPGQTIFRFEGGGDYANVKFTGAPFPDVNTTEPANLRNWTAGYAQGTTNITLSSASGLTAGTMLMLDQLDDNVDVAHAGSEGCDYCGRQSGARSQIQIVTVKSINGNTVTVSPGLYMPNWSASYSPQAWWFGARLEMCGIEDLTINNTVNGAPRNVAFLNARNCWVKNVKSYNANQAHFQTYLTSHIEVRHSYCYGTVNAASQSYGVLWYYSSDGLAEDNIFEKVTSPLIVGAASQGNVNSYNYCTNMFYTVSASWMIAALSTHAGHNAFTLWEGNQATSLYLDFIHGSGSHTTALRNRLLGWEPGKTINTYAIAAEAKNHYHNIVGNILGKSGYHTHYENANAPANTFQAVYHLGYFDTGGSYPTNYDPAVPNTILRHGNHDFATGGIIWDGSIPDHTLPTSYLYSTKPGWFGDRPWPPYDPANPSSDSLTSIPAGYRFVFGTDPPGGTGNQPPMAVANANPKSGPAPLTVNFSSAGSFDPEGTALQYGWTFGDGLTSITANPVHTYQTNGSYVARMIISDGANTTTSADVDIVVVDP